MAEVFANSGDPDQTPQNAASDLDLPWLPITLFYGMVAGGVGIQTKIGEVFGLLVSIPYLS